MVLAEQKVVVYRKKQTDFLESIFGERGSGCPPSLFLFGPAASGKNVTITTLMKNKQLPHAIVDCVEVSSALGLFESVLHALAGQYPGPDSGYRPIYECPNPDSFVVILSQLIKKLGYAGETTYLIFRKADRLRGLGPLTLPSLLMNQALTKLNVCVILLSNISWNIMVPLSTGVAEPMVVEFPGYVREEIIDILCQSCPQPYKGYDGFYRHYASIIVDAFQSATRSLRELQYLTRVNFSKYVEPVDKGEVDAKNSRALYMHIVPFLKAALSSVYLHEMSSTEWESQSSAVKQTKPSLDLPLYSKYLLIASFLCSYNPAKSDTRLFCKNAGKIRKMKSVSKAKRTSSLILGPKNFPLDRLRAVFHCILDESVPHSASIDSQISTLVTLKLLSQVGQFQLTCPKYKCLVSFERAKSIGRSVGFDVTRYLFENS